MIVGDNIYQKVSVNFVLLHYPILTNHTRVVNDNKKGNTTTRLGGQIIESQQQIMGLYYINLPKTIKCY
jgi:hypothetical protein